MNAKKGKVIYALYAVALLITSATATSLLSFTSNNAAYAHTFSQDESAQYLSLTEQIRAEAHLVVMNLKNNNLTLAQAHADNAASLLDSNTLAEIRERNNRIATTLETTLQQLHGNVTALSAPQGQVPSQVIQTTGQAISSLNSTLGEATTVRIDRDQRNNSTTWALAFAEILDATLQDYGNATRAPFDLSNITNMAMMMESHNNSTTSHNVSNGTTENMTKIVNETAYQSAQFLANRTLMQVFNNNLKPLSDTTGNTSATTTNASAPIDQLQSSVADLRNAINNRASPNDVMMIVHGKIHPLLIQIFGLQSS